MDSSGDKQANHLLALDGLRGAACLAVVVHHCYMHGGRYQCAFVHLGRSEFALSRLLFYGYGGVQVFFVLSGFCLAYPFFARSRPDGWSLYFMKRVVRILPPYYAAALFLVAMQILLRDHPLNPFGRDLAPVTLPTRNGLFVCFSLLGVDLNPSFWTLVVEARWYFALPVLLIAWRRSRLATALVVIALSMVPTYLNARVAHFQMLVGILLVYLPVFALGIQAADVTVRGTLQRHATRLRWLVLGAFAILVAFIPREPEPDGGFFKLARLLPWALFSWSLVVAAVHDPLVARIARSRLLVWVGVFSYSLYLIHEPIVHFVYDRVPHDHWSPWTHLVVFELGVAPMCVAVGYLFYCAVERPTMRWAKVALARRRSAEDTATARVSGAPEA